MKARRITYKNDLYKTRIKALRAALIFTVPLSTNFSYAYYPGDLNTRKRTGTSCRIEIHFSIETTEYSP
jgi:hypothetical protein